MENKYCIPNIEEFHVGFEYQQYNGSGFYQNKDIDEKENNIWSECKFDKDYEVLEELLELKNIRVKYLDKQDIESLGWQGQVENSVYFNRNKYRLVHWMTDEGRDISIYEKYDGGAQEQCLVSKCSIKNKSELKKLMKQLDIE